MVKGVYLILLIVCFACTSGKKVIEEHVGIDVYTFEDEGTVKAAAMPELKMESSLQSHKLRFDYLLINVSDIHSIDKVQQRHDIWSLYPDTVQLSKLYLKEFSCDQKLSRLFKKSYLAVEHPKKRKSVVYTEEELMKVASKFFFCDDVLPDTTVQMHICVSLNGMKEADWEKDYTLLEAFCYEAIFHDLDLEISLIDGELMAVKDLASSKFRSQFTTKQAFLENVKQEVFRNMETSEVLKSTLRSYYYSNANNLAFGITFGKE